MSSRLKAELLAKFAFNGTPNHQNNIGAYNMIQTLERDPSNPDAGSIEYVDIRITNSKLVLFVCHGRKRALDEKSVKQWVDLAKEQQVSVVLHNYPGYGDTPGPATECQIRSDTIRLANFIREQKWAIEQEFAVLGNSLGCGPAMSLAAANDAPEIKKVVLASPYTSLRKLVQEKFWFLPLLDKLQDPFAPIEDAHNLRKGTEVLILHGQEDTVIPIEHARELEKKLKSMKVSVTLCEIRSTEHRNTRIRGNQAIFSFLKNQGDLEPIINQLEETGCSLENFEGLD